MTFELQDQSNNASLKEADGEEQLKICFAYPYSYSVFLSAFIASP